MKNKLQNMKKCNIKDSTWKEYNMNRVKHANSAA